MATTMMIRAKGEFDNVYLIETGENRARILDADRGVFFPEQNMATALAQGYWIGYKAKDGELEQLIAACKEFYATDEDMRAAYEKRRTQL